MKNEVFPVHRPFHRLVKQMVRHRRVPSRSMYHTINPASAKNLLFTTDSSLRMCSKPMKPSHSAFCLLLFQFSVKKDNDTSAISTQLRQSSGDSLVAPARIRSTSKVDPLEPSTSDVSDLERRVRDYSEQLKAKKNELERLKQRKNKEILRRQEDALKRQIQVRPIERISRIVFYRFFSVLWPRNPSTTPAT